MYVVAASRPRCLVVATGLTAALWGAAAVPARALTGRQPATPDEALVRLCLAALVIAAGWAWLQAMAGVAAAWRGAAGPVLHPGPRRLALTLCGVALTGALAAPAHAGDGPRPDPLSGLPLPERAEGPAHSRQATVVVRSGDTLWTIAERRLPVPATDRQVTTGWHAIYRRNRGVIGPDPDLILPGQGLSLPRLTQPMKEQP
jgi:nucleoid-associated protein YgaU